MSDAGCDILQMRRRLRSHADANNCLFQGGGCRKCRLSGSVLRRGLRFGHGWTLFGRPKTVSDIGPEIDAGFQFGTVGQAGGFGFVVPAGGMADRNGCSRVSGTN